MKTYAIEVVSSEDLFNMPEVFYVKANNKQEARRKAKNKIRKGDSIFGIYETP